MAVEKGKHAFPRMKPTDSSVGDSLLFHSPQEPGFLQEPEEQRAVRRAVLALVVLTFRRDVRDMNQARTDRLNHQEVQQGLQQPDPEMGLAAVLLVLVPLRRAALAVLAVKLVRAPLLQEVSAVPGMKVTYYPRGKYP